MLYPTPQQNRVEERSTPTSPPPCSQTSTPRSPGEQTFPSNNEIIFFNNAVYKKLYLATVKCLEKTVACDSRIWFLQKCINLKLLPNNSKVKTSHISKLSDNVQNQITENLFNVGLENLKLGLKEERRFFESFKNDFRLAKIDTHKVITEANLHIFFEDRISSVRSKLSKQVKNKHRQKLCFLLEKEGRQIPSFLLNNALSQSKNKKKPRKFIFWLR